MSTENQGTIRPLLRWLKEAGRAIFSGCPEVREPAEASG